MALMLYRSLPDPIPPADADLDTAAMAATQAVVERGEYHLRVLGELTEIGMKLARSLGELAEARIEAAKKEDRALTPAEDATVASFNKVAQTVRRTVALRDKLDAEVKVRRDGLIAERAGRRAARSEAHEAAKKEAVLYGFHDAYAGSTPETEYAEVIERLMEDTEEYLGDADEFRGYLDRPVGETVAKLCAALGLDPDACALDGETWRVRRAPTEFERLLAERALKFGKPPSPSWGGWLRALARRRVGYGEATTVPRNPPLPHPDRFAICPSP